MKTAQSTATVAAVNAFIIPRGAKFTCVVGDKAIGSSKYADYFEYHYRRHDLTALANTDVKQFVHLNADGQVNHVMPVVKPAKVNGLKKEAAAVMSITSKMH
jgi:hypothetical protein